jgi:hypothetical protein
MDFDLPEKITIWNIASNDGLGNFTYTVSIEAARIALKQEKFTDKNGDQKISVAVCYANSPNLKLDSKVYFGESASATPISAANDVRAFAAIPSGTNLKRALF